MMVYTHGKVNTHRCSLANTEVIIFSLYSGIGCGVGVGVEVESVHLKRLKVYLGALAQRRKYERAPYSLFEKLFTVQAKVNKSLCRHGNDILTGKIIDFPVLNIKI